MDNNDNEKESPTKPVPPPTSPLQSPQVMAAIIGGIVTIAVAIVGLVPVLLERAEPTPTPMIVTATPEPTQVLVILSTDTSAPTEIPASPTPQPVVATASELPSTQATEESTTVPTQPPSTIPITEAPLPSAMPPGNVLLLYDDAAFTVLNQDTRTVSLEGVVFRSGSGEWDARTWGTTLYNSLPPRNCLRLRDAASGQRQPPASCANLYGLQLVGTKALFWIRTENFDVLRGGEVIATCEVVATSCLIYIP